MPYRIPSEIKYEERLFGPLTVKQSLYAGIALAIILWAFFFTNLNMMLKFLITGVVGALAIGFIAFDLETKIKNYLLFMKEEKEISWISPAARKLMEIKSIRADTVFLKDGRVLAVVKVRPINFGVLSKEDQDTIIYGFMQFLNSLDFPIQIVMRSVNLDLSDYLDNLKRRIIKRDDKMALAYYEHFSEYMYDYIKENEINDRLFYIVIPAKRHWDEREVIRNLQTRCRGIVDPLSNFGIVSHRLNNKELLNLYASYFTQNFHINEEYLSPITMYRKIWKGAPTPEVEIESQ